MKQIIGRLAPSPTGRLHLGNAWSFLLAWLACRLEDGRIYLRIEDIDPQRSKEEFIQGIVEDLLWLGIDWDGEVVRQSERHSLYEQELSTLGGLVYPCFCTRKELRLLAGAPQELRQSEFSERSDSGNIHGEEVQITKIQATKNRFVMPDMGAPYTGKCRKLSKEDREHFLSEKKSACLRLACPPFFLPREELLLSQFLKCSSAYIGYINDIQKNTEDFNPRNDQYIFHDLLHGEQNISLQDCGGDFALRRSDGVWAYQLAVTCDDKNMGVNQIIRGDDILTSTPRQLYLYKLLGYEAPKFAHVPLLLDAQGERLAKRHESLSLQALRERDRSPEKALGILTKILGMEGKFSSAKEILEKLQNIGYKKFPWELLAKHKDEKGIIVEAY